MTAKMGRPTKYKPEYCEKLIYHMAHGYSFESFAATVRVCRETLYDWCKAHEDFLHAKNAGRDASLLRWEEINIAQATGQIKGSASNTIFTLKSRFGWREADEENNDINVTLNYKLDDD